MLIPSARQCDFCQQPIVSGDRYASLIVPLPPSVRELILRHLDRQLIAAHGSAPPPGLVAAMVPQEWTLEICVRCTFGIFPEVRQRIEAQVTDTLDRQLAAQARARESLQELEP